MAFYYLSPQVNAIMEEKYQAAIKYIASQVLAGSDVFISVDLTAEIFDKAYQDVRADVDREVEDNLPLRKEDSEGVRSLREPSGKYYLILDRECPGSDYSSYEEAYKVLQDCRILYGDLPEARILWRGMEDDAYDPNV